MLLRDFLIDANGQVEVAHATACLLLAMRNVRVIRGITHGAIAFS